MKKIIITGGLGYIGMELSKIYSGKSRYLDITVIDNKFYSNRVSQLKRWGINYIRNPNYGITELPNYGITED